MKKLWARLRGDHRGVADIDFAEGRYLEAARSYARAEDHVSAAKAAAAGGDEKLARSYAERIPNPHDAGVLLASEGMDRMAIGFFEKSGAYWQAAECALRSNQVRRAAAFYESSGALERAADCYERAGAVEETLRVLGDESQRLEAGNDPTARRRVDVRRAKLLAKLGRVEKAAEVLSGCGQHLAAAEMWSRAGALDRAAGEFLAAGSAHRAASLVDALPSGTDAELRARVLAAAERNSEAAAIWAELGQVDRAIEMWEACGDYLQAAKGFREHGMYDRAADLYFRAGDYGEAAFCYRQAGDLRSAARALRELGLPHDAGALYLEADDPLRAARAFLDAQDRSSAIAALQAIRRDDSDYAESAMLLAPLLIAERRSAEAMDVLEARSLIGNMSDAEVDEVAYWRARAHEGAGEVAAAERSYERLAKRDEPYRDSAERLTRLRADRKSRSEDERDTLAVVEVFAGTVIDDRWEVIEELGRGGTSRVFRVHDRRRDEEVALKILLGTCSDRSTAEERLLTEARIGRRLDHRAVLRGYDVGRYAGCLFVTMELLEGRTLEQILQEEGRLPLRVAHTLLTQIVAGLEAAHEEGILHRDLKPSNVAISPDGVRLMDFGIALFVDRDLSLTQTGQVIGSPMYMSPEQIQGRDLDGRTDLYSLGILVFTMLTGLEPFRGRTATAISLKHLQEEPPDIRVSRPGVPPQWDDLVHWLLAKDRADRPESASVVAAAVANLPVEEAVDQD